MGLRVGTAEDIELVMKLSMKFSEQIGQVKFFDEEDIRALAMGLLTGDKSEKIIFLYDDVGILAAVASKFIFGKVKVSTEVIFWVDPDKRNLKIGEELLSAYEYWSKEVGCEIASMTCLNDKVGAFYEKRGYKPYEKSYAKEI